MYDVLGDRNICVVREISKKFEEKTFSTLSAGYTGTIKGEFVVIVDKPQKASNENSIDEDLKVLLSMGISKTDASKVLAKARGLKKNEVYQNAIEH